MEKTEIFCAAFAAAAYLKTAGIEGKVYVVGEVGILEELNEMRIEVRRGASLTLP